MGLRGTQYSLFILNAAATLAAVATILIAWNGDRRVAWLGIGSLICATLLARASPLFYMVGVVTGPGLLAYAMTDSRLAGALASIVVTLAFYLFTWQARKLNHTPSHRASRGPAQPRG
jgi:hypothetical protein